MISVHHAFSQQSCSYRRRSLSARSAPLDESCEYALDLALWARLKSQGVRWQVISDVLGVLGNTRTNKTSCGGGAAAAAREFERVCRTCCHGQVLLTAWHRLLRFALERRRSRHPGRLCATLVRPLQTALVLALRPFCDRARVRAMDWGIWT